GWSASCAERSERQAEAARQAPEEAAVEGVDAAAGAQLEHLRERDEEGRLEARLDAPPHHQHRPQLEAEGAQSLAPERIGVRYADFESLLVPAAQRLAPVADGEASFDVLARRRADEQVRGKRAHRVGRRIVLDVGGHVADAEHEARAEES